jgi:hypothetical protein
MKIERKAYQGISPIQPDLWVDKVMDRFSRSKFGKVFAAVTGISLLTSVATTACENARPTNQPSETAPVPGAPSATPRLTETNVPTPSPTAEYHLGSGGRITQADIDRMETQDPLLSGRLDYLNQWYQWYQDADPSIRPFSPDRPESMIFYSYVDQNGATRFLPAWKFDDGDYAGKIILPPAAGWTLLSPPVTASSGHEIAPGQGIVEISTTVTAGSFLANMGVPVGSQLAVENGTGAFVMVLNDQVVGRVGAEGHWQLENLYPIDMEKLNTTPKSYDYLTSHLDEYVRSPDPLADSQAGQVFLDWVKNELIPALGDETKLEKNVWVGDGGYYNNELALSGESKPLMGQPEFFYFEHQNKVYPVLILSAISIIPGNQQYWGKTVMVILTEENDKGWGALGKLAEGKLIRGIVLYPRVDCPYIPDIGKQMVAAGLDASVYRDHWRLPAAGHIQTLP